jgi:Txe/YoeB family toxin of Txe-Axe toxin-antitoxin module
VKSRTAARFWKLFEKLPSEIQKQAYKAHEEFVRDPFHPSLNFEQIDTRNDMWSARVSEKYRVIGKRLNDEIRWFWIGTHKDYERFTGKH